MQNLNQFIKKILLSFEQSQTHIKYNAVYLWNDGPSNAKQITLSFGITEYGNLKPFIEQYCHQNGKYTKDFLKYIPLITKQPLAGDTNFINLLKESAQDIIMQQCQEKAFESMYIQPALNWCNTSNLILPLSKTVIADSFLQSGSILTSLRNKFSAKIPAHGGDEKEWVTSYCNIRKSWLANHSRKILNNTVYRPDFFISLLKEEDWNLTQETYIANGVKIVAS